MNNPVYGKTMKNANHKKDYLKWTLRSSYVAQKIFYNALVAIHKLRLLRLNKLAYVRINYIRIN